MKQHPRVHVLSVVSCFLLFQAQLQVASAQDATAAAEAATQAAATHQCDHHEENLHIDLGSTAQTVIAPQSAVPINVGGEIFTAAPGSLVTSAQLMAMCQVAHTGEQSLVLGALGNAIGGSFNLNAGLASRVSNLVIPEGVTAITNAALGNLNFTGNLTNNGSLLAFSNNSAVNSVAIQAGNIVNTGVLSTMASTAALQGVQSTVSQLNLSLFAINNIVNSGQILSSGNLNLQAGNSVINALGSVTAATTPTIQSLGALNIMAGSGVITNVGLINSLSGNINITADASRNLIFNNTGGTLQALAGSINFRETAFAGTANLSIVGGNLLAQVMNINAGCGLAQLDVGRADGLLNITAGQTAVSAATENLNLGDIVISADPAFYNTTGDVTINGDLQFAADLAIVASRDVITGPGAGIISTNSGSGDAGNIIIVAGADFTATTALPPPAPVEVQPTIPDVEDPNIMLTITGASSTGGKIDLTSGTSITQLSATGANKGGYITLVAFDGVAPTSSNPGTVSIPGSVTIDTRGGVSSGSVAIIAGGATAQPIQIGPINASGTTSGVLIDYAQPEVSAGGVKILGGTLQSGYFYGGPNGPGGTVATGNLDVTSAGMTIASTSASIALGDIITRGTNVAVLSAKDITAAPGAILDTSSSLGGGGMILAAGLNMEPAAGVFSLIGGVLTTLNPPSGNAVSTGGSIDLTNAAKISTATTGAFPSQAGALTLISFEGTAPGSGLVITPQNVKLDLTGGGTAEIFAGYSSGSGLAIDIGEVDAGGSLTSFSEIRMETGNRASLTGVTNGLGLFTVAGPCCTMSSISTGSLSASGNLSIVRAVNVLINGDVNVSGYFGGSSVSISTNSSTEFQLGAGATTNGINGVVRGDAPIGLIPSIISISNSGTGGINVLPGSLSTVSGAGPGKITLDAGLGPLTLNDVPSLLDPGIGLVNNGRIILSGSPIRVIGHTTLSLSCPGCTGGAPLISVTSRGPGDLRIGPGSGELSILVDTPSATLQVFARSGGNLSVVSDIGGPGSSPISELHLTSSQIDISANLYSDLITFSTFSSQANLGVDDDGINFNLSQSELLNAHGTVVSVGRDTPNGFEFADSFDIVLADDLDLSTSSASEIRFRTNGFYEAKTGTTLTVGDNNLDLAAVKGILTGAISGGTGNLLLRTSSDPAPVIGNLRVEGPITVGPTGTILLRANNTFSSILLNGDVGGGLSTELEVGQFGDIGRTSGVLSGDVVSLTGFGTFGLPSNPIATAANSLIVLNTGSVYISQTGPVNLGTTASIPITVGGELVITASGAITAAFPVIAGTVQLIANNADIILSANVQGVATTGTAVSLNVTGTGTIRQDGGVVLAGPMSAPLTPSVPSATSLVYLSTESGDVGSFTDPILTVTPGLSISTCCGSNAFVSNANYPSLTLYSVSTGGNAAISNDADTYVGNVRTENGSINILTFFGGLAVLEGAKVIANNGNLTLQTFNAGVGIFLDDGANIGAASSSPGLGIVNLIAGGSNPPSNPTQTDFNGIQVLSNNGGTVFLDGANFHSVGAGNTIDVDGKDVVFEGGNIGIGNGVRINAGSRSSLLSSLDFTDAQTIGHVQYLQAKGILGGDFSSGTIVIAPANLDFVISAQNIPVGVVVTMTDFESSQGYEIVVGPSSTSSNVVVDGTQQFFSSSTFSTPTISISSNSGISPNVMIGSSGSLTSDGDLTLSTTGTFANGGIVSGNGLVGIQSTSTSPTAISNAGQITGDALFLSSNTGSITNSGTLGGNTSVSVQVNKTAGGISNTGDIFSNGSVGLQTNGGDISGSGTVFGASLVFLQAMGGGRISYSGTINSDQSVSLNSQLSDIGSPTQSVTVGAPAIDVGAFGSAYIHVTNSVDLNGISTSGVFDLTVDGSVYLVFDMYADSVNLRTSSGAQNDIVLNANIFATTSVILSAGGTGSILAPGNTPGSSGGGGGGVVFFGADTFGLGDGGALDAYFFGPSAFAAGGGGPGSSFISGTTVTLATNDGHIGVDANPVVTNASNLAVTAGGAGSVVVENSNTPTVTLTDSSAGGAFSFVNFGDVTNMGNVTANAGNVSLRASRGQATILAGAQVIARDGAVTIVNEGPTDSIAVQQGAQISSIATNPALRQVSLIVGATPPAGSNFGPTPNVNQILTNGGRVFFNTGIETPGSVVALVADAGTIAFDVVGGAASQISIDGAQIRAIGPLPGGGGPGPGPAGGGGEPAPSFNSVPSQTSGSSVQSLRDSLGAQLALLLPRVDPNSIGGTRVATDTTPTPPDIQLGGTETRAPVITTFGSYDPDIISDEDFSEKLAMISPGRGGGGAGSAPGGAGSAASGDSGSASDSGGGGSPGAGSASPSPSLAFLGGGGGGSAPAFVMGGGGGGGQSASSMSPFSGGPGDGDYVPAGLLFDPGANAAADRTFGVVYTCVAAPAIRNKQGMADMIQNQLQNGDNSGDDKPKGPTSCP